MNKVLKLLVACALAVATSGAWAHGTGVHAKGTLKRVSAARLVVQTEEGEKAFQLSPATKFLKGSSPSSAADLHPGDRVVVHAKEANGALEATQVRFGAASRPGHAH
jgi:hypothetical protein